jgi:hypothetical protein
MICRALNVKNTGGLRDEKDGKNDKHEENIRSVDRCTDAGSL